MTAVMSSMKKGECGKITGIENTGNIRRRLMDIGFTKGTSVRCIGKSPLGDPTAFMVKGAVIALRAEDSSKILIEFNPERNTLTE